MASNARIISIWTARDCAQVTVDGPVTDDLAERLDRVLELLVIARARHITVDLSRMDGTDGPVLELLAAACHLLWNVDGCLHVVGLRDRLASRPEVTAFPELFGPQGERERTAPLRRDPHPRPPTPRTPTGPT